jgi:hypothetical protein
VGGLWWGGGGGEERENRCESINGHRYPDALEKELMNFGVLRSIDLLSRKSKKKKKKKQK